MCRQARGECPRTGGRTLRQCRGGIQSPHLAQAEYPMDGTSGDAQAALVPLGRTVWLACGGQPSAGKTPTCQPRGGEFPCCLHVLEPHHLPPAWHEGHCCLFSKMGGLAPKCYGSQAGAVFLVEGDYGFPPHPTTPDQGPPPPTPTSAGCHGEQQEASETKTWDSMSQKEAREFGEGKSGVKRRKKSRIFRNLW